MKFSEFVSKIDKGSITPGTEPKTLRTTTQSLILDFQKMKKKLKEVEGRGLSLNKILKEFCGMLSDIGDELTTNFETETLRKLGGSCYDLAEELADMDDEGEIKEKLEFAAESIDEIIKILKQTAFFDFTEKGISEFLTKKLKSIRNFKRIVSVKTDSYNASDSKEFKFIAEFDDRLDFDERTIEKNVKKALRDFEFVSIDKKQQEKVKDCQVAFEAQFDNASLIKENFYF